MNKDDKIILLHEWLYQNGGSEKVVNRFIHNFKQHSLSIFVLFKRKYKFNESLLIDDLEVRKSFLHYLPFIQFYYRFVILFSFDLLRMIRLKNAKIILSSSHAVIKNVPKPKGSLHISYCHTPMRYIWDLYDDYYAHSSSFVRIFLKIFVKKLRKIDKKSVQNVDYFIANSNFVKQRIKKYYDREAEVIYPPVDDAFFSLCTKKREDFYVCIGRMVPYKKIDLIVEAFSQMPDLKLVLIGDGYNSKDIIAKVASFKNINYVGHLSNEELKAYLQKSKASIFAAKEDFGIGCVESQLCGTPVIALKNGGYLETVDENLSGYFFDSQNVEDLKTAILKMESHPLADHVAIHNHAMQFSSSTFDEHLKTYVNKVYHEFFDRKQK